MIWHFKKILFVVLAAVLISKNFYTPVLVNSSCQEFCETGQVFETA